jgi:uncharacterized protein YidB (DUF937 family)
MGLLDDILEQVADAADTLSKLLPQVVDKLTPKGDIEPSDLLGEGLNALKKSFG